MSIRPSENEALLTEISSAPESLSRRFRPQLLSASIRWRKRNDEGVMLHEITSIQRREDGSIDHDHYRDKASRLRSQAIFDVFSRGYRAIYRFHRIVLAANRSKTTKKVA
jgi:hypothetical protein